jgi:two-component system CheB/CheR fusion protein
MGMKKRTSPESEPVSTVLPVSFPIVGIGASAGGLEAFREMLDALPPDSGMAIVLIRHLDPSHDSMLASLLAGRSVLPVTQVRDNEEIKPNHVYVIPANTSMGIQDGLFSLTKRAGPGGKHLPIDHFFESLAAYAKDEAIGVVLSGTGTDGTYGLKAIKAQGGVCFAQDEESAGYPGMPASAIAAGSVDFVLPPREIGAELLRVVRQRRLQMTSPTSGPADPGVENSDLHKLLLSIRDATGTDFSGYKPNSIQRRIARRMLLKNIPTLREYREAVRGDSGELDALYRDILIHASSFFREPGTFETLKSCVLPALMENKPKDKPLRVWVPGCSTGEEAYSIAMLLAECLDDPGKTPVQSTLVQSNLVQSTLVQIFGTDINAASIEFARAGVYQDATLAQVNAARMARFFVRSDGGYRVAQSIRDMCIFARQDLTQDPSFSHIDLISCRNVLIYFEPDLQRKVLADFHFALNNGGLLLLGNSETLHAFQDLFTVSAKKGPFFRKRSLANPPYLAPAGLERAVLSGIGTEPARPAVDLSREADRIVWNRYAGVIVNDSLQILHFRGDTSPYLAPASGTASLHLLKMIRSEFLADVRDAFLKAKKENAPMRKEGIRAFMSGVPAEVSLEAIPLPPLNAPDRHFLILFESRSRPAQAVRAPDQLAPLEKLQRDPMATREYLQTVIEEQERTNEELKAANEEALSNNEELQSANEELQTPKEELQSSNEELITLTEQQASRNNELTQAYDDLKNVFEGLRIPILLLDGDRRIRRFNRSAEQVFNLMAADVGRPIQSFRLNLDLPDLQPLISRTLERLTPQRQEVRDLSGHYYTMSVRPYRTSDHKIDGVMIKLFDTDAMKRSLLEAGRARDYAGAIVDTVREPLLVLDAEHRIVNANRSFRETFHVTREEITNHGIFELAGGGWEHPEFRRLLDNMGRADVRFDDFKLTHHFPGIGRRTLLLNSRQLHWKGETPGMILLVMEDVTERESFLEALKNSEERLRFLTAGLLNAQEKERSRISRELHDDFNQRLAMLAVELAALENASSLSADAIRTQLAAIRTRAEDISDGIRRTAHQLHPSVVDHLGLPSALRSLCRDFSRDKLRVQYRGRNLAEPIPPDIAISLYRVAQEALRNVERHSKASRATVSLTAHKKRVLLTIGDTGVGFDPKLARARRGMGIVSMEERVRLVKGTLTIRSNPGGGTRVAVQIQLPEIAMEGEES